MPGSTCSRSAGAPAALRSFATARGGGAAGRRCRRLGTGDSIVHRQRGWHRRPRSPQWLALVADLVAVLRAELEEGDERLRRCVATSPGRTDLDVLDLCLAGGVPVAPIPFRPEASARDHLDVARWKSGAGARPTATSWRSPPTEQFLPFLIAGLRRDLGAQSDSSESPAAAGIQVGRDLAARTGRAAGGAAERWLADLGAALGPAPTMLALAEALDCVAPLWSAGGVALGPRTFAAFAAAVDASEALARTLRGGTAAGLTWPAYERAYEEFSHTRS